MVFATLKSLVPFSVRGLEENVGAIKDIIYHLKISVLSVMRMSISMDMNVFASQELLGMNQVSAVSQP